MLELLRRQSVLIYGIFGAIVLIFAINFGPGAGGCTAQIRPKQWVARVDGVVIGPEQFALTLSDQYEDMRRRAEAAHIPFDRSMAERIGLRRRVVDALVDRRLLVAEALARGVTVSDERLLEALRRDYGAGELTYAAYEERVGRMANMTVEKFEAYVRDGLASNYLMHALRDAVEVSEDELKRHFVREHERLRLRVARFAVDASQVPTPGQEAIAMLLEQEPAALQGQYDRDIEDFATPAKVRAVQIVRTLDANASVEAVAKATAELAEAHKQLQAGSDFAALASSLSQDERSKAAGGDMGFVAQSEVDPALATALFALPVGGMTDQPVRTRQGLHLLKKVEEQPAGRKQLEEVRPELAARVLKLRVAQAKAEQAAERFIAALSRAPQRFAELANLSSPNTLQLGDKPKRSAGKPSGFETNWLLRTDTRVGALGEAPALVAAAFGHGAGGLRRADEVSQKPIALDDAVVVVQLKDREHADLGNLKSERDELREVLLGQKRQRVLAAWLDHLRSQAKVDKNPAYMAPVAVPTAPEAGTEADEEGALAG